MAVQLTTRGGAETAGILMFMLSIAVATFKVVVKLIINKVVGPSIHSSKHPGSSDPAASTLPLRQRFSGYCVAVLEL
ncbi:unnamed protein product [Orchesella dallaii]|uniref:Uncharacterized protein n=1 Tax=Orchesella dallaii TaxID=48710 RepID=A0ABP1R4U0_9HEXA